MTSSLTSGLTIDSLAEFRADCRLFIDGGGMSPVVADASSGRIDALFRLVAAMIAIVLFEIERKRYGKS